MHTRVRAALRLKAFEARPDAKSSVPVMEVKSGRTGLPATVANVVQAPTEADHGSLVQARLAAKQQRYSTCCVAVETKESMSESSWQQGFHRNPNQEK